MRRLLHLGLLLLLLALATPARADAVITWSRVDAPDPTTAIQPGVIVWSWLGYQQTVPVKCMKVQFSRSPHGLGGLPTGLDVTDVKLKGRYLSGYDAYIHANWPGDVTQAASGILTFSNTTGHTPGPLDNYFGLAFKTEAAVEGNVWVTVTTYDAVGDGISGTCAGNVLDGPATSNYWVSNPTRVTGEVLPSLQFSVAPQSTPCNGVNIVNGTSSGSSVKLGSLSQAKVNTAAQGLSVQTNSANGFNVYLSSSATTRNQVLNNALGASITDTAGTVGAPAALSAGTEGFGYSRAGLGTGANVFAQLPLKGTSDVVSNGIAGVMSATSCVIYGASINGTTPAGQYVAQISYRAVPSF